MSKQMTFMLACAVVLSALVPGVAGYLSARWEAIESAERNLHALEARLHLRQARDAHPVSYPAPCLRTPIIPRTHQVPATALGDHRRWLRDLPGWVPEGVLQELDSVG
ncbi:hypothetical protein ITP53_34655 [Nonomuraea sp. K274]|uniref:Uncharacterized protein n=1 Tax=Nonomuraea cypriaca TaxID=1187855 RepID=A0A931F4D0_9ACTN|nr:hypothetical protein [Nonomuraea cypriaca]MBF8190763.1 hypothetical protein [Nonomuraea cypriaca]